MPVNIEQESRSAADRSEVSSEQSAYTGRRRSLRAGEGGEADRADQRALAAEAETTQRRRHE
eukprot:5282337-Prymnesium_polylepis.1